MSQNLSFLITVFQDVPDNKISSTNILEISQIEIHSDSACSGLSALLYGFHAEPNLVKKMIVFKTQLYKYSYRKIQNDEEKVRYNQSFFPRRFLCKTDI